MFLTRIDRPASADLPDIERRLATGEPLVVQFNAAPYDDAVLAGLDRLAAGPFGDRLQVRFYSHHRAAFDGRTLARLPYVRCLSLDCLDRIEHVDQIAALQHLRHFSLGVYELADGSLLSAPNLRHLTHLALGATRTPVFDLSAVTGMTELTEVWLDGHTRNVERLADAPAIRRLSLRSIPVRTSIAFVSRMRSLRSLHLFLGGRADLLEVDVPDLEELEVARVRGLRELGNLGRFPKLARLRVEDQIQLETIQFGATNSALQAVQVSNCKTLHTLAGIEALPRLEAIRVFRTAVDPEALRRDRLAPSLNAFAFGTGKATADRAIRASSAALGYGPPGECASPIGLEWRRPSA